MVVFCPKWTGHRKIDLVECRHFPCECSWLYKSLQGWRSKPNAGFTTRMKRHLLQMSYSPAREREREREFGILQTSTETKCAWLRSCPQPCELIAKLSSLINHLTLSIPLATSIVNNILQTLIPTVDLVSPTADVFPLHSYIPSIFHPSSPIFSTFIGTFLQQSHHTSTRQRVTVFAHSSNNRWFRCDCSSAKCSPSARGAPLGVTTGTKVQLKVPKRQLGRLRGYTVTP